MIISHKIRLDPNNKQATYLAKAAGTARFAYNWALAEWQRQYAAWKADNSQPKPNQMSLRRQLNAIKREQFPWMMEVTKNAPQKAIIQLGAAFNHFFAGCAKYPRFKKKGKSRDSPVGWAKHLFVLPTIGASNWWATKGCCPPYLLSLSKGAVGVDLGVSALATLSTGEKVTGAKPHKALLSRMKRLSRSLSRKVKGSANRHKAKQKLAKLHARIANIRRDGLHKLTTDLTRRFHTIGIEDLNVSGMVKNHHLSRAISDMGFFEFRRQLEYKAAMRGGMVVVADRFFTQQQNLFCLWRQNSKPSLIRAGLAMPGLWRPP